MCKPTKHLEILKLKTLVSSRKKKTCKPVCKFWTDEDGHKKIATEFITIDIVLKPD